MTDHATLVPGNSQIKDEARARARAVLSGMKSFEMMPIADQKSIYLSLVQEYVDKARARHGLSRPMATDSGKEMGYKGYDPGFQGDTQAFNELVDSVDFPKFVADLLKAVFDANLKVMKQQTDSYIKLMKEATKSTADFIKKVKDDDALAKVAETQSDKYNIADGQGGRRQPEVGADDPRRRQGRSRGCRGQARPSWKPRSTWPRSIAPRCARCC